MVEVLQEFLGRRPKLLGSIGQVFHFASICPIKKQVMGDVRERKFN
jgi:hypothetical protein